VPLRTLGGFVAKLSKHRRLALRFCIYIKALGAVPLAYQGQSVEAYAIVLQKQYENLRHECGAEASRAALIAGRAKIKEKGFAEIAAEFPFAVPPTRKKRRGPKTPTDSRPTEQSAPATSRNGSERLRKGELYNCRRKFRHINYLSALLHARRLHDDDLHIYGCDICDGLHVGHDASASARRRRRITKQLVALQTKIEELDRERTQLRRQQLQLRSELTCVLEECHEERPAKANEDGVTAVDSQVAP
jgi:hypothetical protein